MNKALLLQLPVPGFLWPTLDANIPLAAGYLASWARGPARVQGWELEILPWQEADILGDEALLAAIRSRNPDLVGLSLSLWNAERSLALGRRLREAGLAVAVGGPEVTADHPWLWESEGFTAAVVGEGEEAFVRLLDALTRGGDLRSVTGAFGPSCVGAPHMPLDLAKLPSPYLSGLLPLHPDGSVWLETLRGCPFGCTYCRYGKDRRTLQTFRPGWLREHLAWAAKSGARELYLMDPSFNVRADWAETLTTLEAADSRGTLALHAELVADALPPGDGTRLARAGLASCEVGLQSIHPAVLSVVGRSWERDRWVRGVRELTDAGVKVVVGLIAGLPGDDLCGFSRSLDFLRTEVPDARIQVFPLAVLPGTKLREESACLGIQALDRPPYTVLETRGFSGEDLRSCFDLFEDTTGLEIDPLGNPSLTGGWSEHADSVPFISGVRLDALRAPDAWVDAVLPRAAQNLTLWVRGWRESLPAEVGRLCRRLPHGVLTVVLEDRPGWPASRLGEILAESGAGDHYLDRYFQLLYRPGSRLVPRLVALVAGGPARWVDELRRQADVVRCLSASSNWIERAASWARDGETVFVRGNPGLADLARLWKELGPEDARGLVYGSEEAQAAWERMAGGTAFRAPDHRISIP